MKRQLEYKFYTYNWANKEIIFNFLPTVSVGTLTNAVILVDQTQFDLTKADQRFYKKLKSTMVAQWL